MSDLLQLARERVVVYDGSMGATILNMQLTAEDYGGKEGCNDYLVMMQPHIIEGIHASYLELGVDVIETDTFGGSLIKLDEYGIGDLTYELNRTAAALARKVADEYSTASRPRFVAGSIGPTGLLPASEDPMLGNHRFHEIVDLFTDQIRGLIDGGSDILIIETVQDILELKAAIYCAMKLREAGGRAVPIHASLTLDTSERMLLGTDIAAGLSILEHLPVDFIGLNCSTGPEYMREPARYLGEYSTRPVAIIPNAGIPINQDGMAVFPLEPDSMARQLREMTESFQVGLVGGCCGTTPDHLQQTLREIGTRPVTLRPEQPRRQIASMIRAVDLTQEPAPLIVGERLNAQGSRKVKRLALADDFDGMVAIGVEQTEEGAHALDVCMALTERADEQEIVRKLVKKLALNVEAPLVIDSTEAERHQGCAGAISGPGDRQFDQHGKRSHAYRVGDAAGQGSWRGGGRADHRRDRHGQDARAQAGNRANHLRHRHAGIRTAGRRPDLRRADLHAGDRRSGIQRIGHRDDRGHPRHQGRHARGLYDSRRIECLVRLEPARAARAERGIPLLLRGKRGSISRSCTPRTSFRFAEIPEEERKLAEDLIFYRKPEALQEYIQYFEGREDVAETGGPDPMAEMTVRERLHYRIVYRKKEGVEADVDLAVAEAGDPVDVLNNVLLPA